jgi:hypothetical protein
MNSRFQELRQRQDAGLLTEAEQAELAQLTEEIEATEGRYLGPATERMRREREAIEKQNRSLENLARRKEALLQRLQAFLAESATERRAIERELAGVLSGPQGSQAGK